MSPILFGIFLNDLHTQVQSGRPAAGTERPPASQACSNLMVLHCSQHWQKVFSSSWIACSHPGLQMISPSASQDGGWLLVGVSVSALGKWLGRTSRTVDSSNIWASCSMRMETPSMPFKPATVRLVHRSSASSLATLVCSAVSQHKFCLDYSKPFCSLVPRMTVRPGPQLMQLLARLVLSRICNTPSCAMRAISRMLSPLTTSLRSFLWADGMVSAGEEWTAS